MSETMATMRPKTREKNTTILDIKIETFFSGKMAALRNVHLDIPKNKITAFIGPSGCGKSTTLRCLNRMHPQNRTRLEGEILFDNQNLYHPTIDPRMVRVHIGMVFQQPNPFHLSVFENVAFGLRLNGFRGDLQERVEQILATRPAPFPERLVFKVDGRRIILKRDEIVWVEAESNYSILHLAGSKKLMLRETLSSLENRLGSSLFIRINRSALVNVEQVQELQPNRNGDYFVMLRTGVNLPLSRHLRGHLESFF